jgi:hypothetical protein
VRGGKRPGAGRKKGSTTLPASYWLAILQTVDEVRRKRNLRILAACRAICDEGGLKWMASDFAGAGVGFKALARVKPGAKINFTRFVTITEIKKARTLRSRYYQAREFVRTNGIPPDRPRIPRHRYSIYKATTTALLPKPMREDWYVFMPNVVDAQKLYQLIKH